MGKIEKNKTDKFELQTIGRNIIHKKIHLNSAEDAWRDAQTSGYIGGGFTGFEAASLAGGQGRITPKCSRDEMTAGWFEGRCV